MKKSLNKMNKYNINDYRYGEIGRILSRIADMLFIQDKSETSMEWAFRQLLGEEFDKHLAENHFPLEPEQLLEQLLKCEEFKGELIHLIDYISDDSFNELRAKEIRAAKEEHEYQLAEEQDEF